MKRILILLAFFLLGYVSPAYLIAAQQEEKAISSIDLTYDTEGYVSGAKVTHRDSVVRSLGVLPLPTNTPRPTITPSSTSGFEPTQDIATQPSHTPGPTTIPIDTSCYGGVVAAGLNVRTDHTITPTRLGILVQAQQIAVTSIYIVKPEGDPQREEWGSVTYDGQMGWIALWYSGEELAVLDDTSFCWELPTEYVENSFPPAVPTRVPPLLSPTPLETFTPIPVR